MKRNKRECKKFFTYRKKEDQTLVTVTNHKNEGREREGEQKRTNELSLVSLLNKVEYIAKETGRELEKNR